MGKKAESSSREEEFFFSNVHRYVGDVKEGEQQPLDDLSEKEHQRFTRLIVEGEFKKTFSDYHEKLGQFQFGLQAFFLNETEVLRLRSFVQNRNEADVEDDRKIEGIAQSAKWVTHLRRTVFFGVIALFVGFIVQRALPEFQEKLDALRFLGHEAIALDQDPVGRLDLKVTDFEMIKEYLKRYPGLGFQATALENFSDQWEASGASIIDYDYAKVSVVQYRRPLPGQEKAAAKASSLPEGEASEADEASGELAVSEGEEDESESALEFWQYEYLYHFSFAGNKAELPKSESATLGGFRYEAFTSDEHNFIAWKDGSGTVSLLVGKSAATELAQYARTGI